MSVKILFCIIYALLCVANGLCSYMGSEESLRQNIADLLAGKLNLSNSNLPYEEDELSDTTPKNHSEYDFIVIGAGSAGATIASRLSEIRNVTVLLIEAGGKEYSIVDIPSLTNSLWSNGEVSWKYETESSDKYCLAQESHRCSWPRGKIMGGSSSINSMLAMRGHQRDYDEWARETGDDSWSYANMLKYFEKLENFYGNRQYKNKTGPIHITTTNRRPQISESFLEAAQEMGLLEFKYDGPEQVGFTYFHTTTFKGERWSSNRAYLRPDKRRKNLILTQHSLVQKILIENTTKNAFGVRYSKHGKIYEAKAKKEIILSAGAINSPQILMLSGVGPKSHLQDLNINVIKEAPVGENLIDHVAYGRHLTFYVNDSSSIEMPNILNPEDPSITNYIHNRSGILSYGTRMNALALFHVDNFVDSRPDFEIIFAADDPMITNKSLASESDQYYALSPVLMRPRSRGKILLRSDSPLDKPKIYPNYLEDPQDVRRLIKGIRTTYEFAKTKALKRHGSEFQQFSSDCDVYGKDTDKYWECELREQTSSAAHPVGTCRMGRKNSSSAGVDSQLKVVGINGLRVADASIMPNIVAAHTNIPVIAIGEKAADLIKIQHGFL